MLLIYQMVNLVRQRQNEQRQDQGQPGLAYLVHEAQVRIRLEFWLDFHHTSAYSQRIEISWKDFSYLHHDTKIS